MYSEDTVDTPTLGWFQGCMMLHAEMLFHAWQRYNNIKNQHFWWNTILHRPSVTWRGGLSHGILRCDCVVLGSVSVPGRHPGWKRQDLSGTGIYAAPPRKPPGQPPQLTMFGAGVALETLFRRPVPT